MKKKINHISVIISIIISIVILLINFSIANIYYEQEKIKVTIINRQASTTTSKKSQETQNKKVSKASKNPKIEVTSKGLTYVNGVLLVNKQYKLPKKYAPGTNKKAKKMFNKMKAAAKRDGITLFIKSGYRSYATQKYVFRKNARRYGTKKANTFSAKPGQSEHQTGLAFDINSTLYSFGKTKAGRWLAKNCYKYGFIIRYPKGKEKITGYRYEPWHIRYVGKEHAKKIKKSGQCLEEYLGVKKVKSSNRKYKKEVKNK